MSSKALISRESVKRHENSSKGALTVSSPRILIQDRWTASDAEKQVGEYGAYGMQQLHLETDAEGLHRPVISPTFMVRGCTVLGPTFRRVTGQPFARTHNVGII